MHHRFLIVVVGASLLLPGCSSRPRPFAPSLAAVPVDQKAFDEAYGTCRQLFVAGKLDQSGKVASAGAGAAASATAAAVGGVTAATVAGYGGLAIASATVILLPFAAVGGAIGMAKAKRAKKEKAIKTAMTGCLADRGYRVDSWAKVDKRDRVKATFASKDIAPAKPTPGE